MKVCHDAEAAERGGGGGGGVTVPKILGRISDLEQLFPFYQPFVF